MLIFALYVCTVDRSLSGIMIGQQDEVKELLCTRIQARIQRTKKLCPIYYEDPGDLDKKIATTLKGPWMKREDDKPAPANFMNTSQVDRSPRLATHYDVLGLTPALLASHHDPQALLKKAYRCALLRHHPDKARQGLSAGPAEGSGRLATIDEITAAYAVLSSPRERAAYDNSLRLSRDGRPLPRFQAGVENVDLDDLLFDEVQECWYRSCRCGNEKAYLFDEANLEEVADEGELMVGCLSCSLWLRVQFAVLDEEVQQASTAAHAHLASCKS